MVLLLVLVVTMICVTAVASLVVREMRGRLGRRDVGETFRLEQRVDERLARMEDAMDAMAIQIDRLRAREERRYVTGGTSDEPDAGTPRDPPPSA
ncbi:MAG: hypothetical protein ABIP66_17575 [Gemmatimonadaceae bacterium]